MVSRVGPEDLLALKYVRAACLSPDGRSIAYCVSHTDDSEHFAIWIGRLDTDDRCKLPYAGDANLPSWSPDGKSIAFVGDGHLRVADADSLAVSEPLTPEGHRVEGKPSWAPDSRRVAISLSEHSVIAGPRRIVEPVYRVDGLGFLDRYSQRIYEVAIAEGRLRCLTPGEQFCSQPEWSPCGRRILCLARDSVVWFATGTQRLHCVRVDDGTIEPLLGDGWYVEAARWVRGGQRIVVAAAKDSTLTIPALSLWVVDASTGNAELRTPGLMGNVGFRLNHDMPARDLISLNGLVVRDQRSAFVSVQKGGAVESWQISLDGPVEMTPVLRGDRTCIAMDINVERDVLLFATTDLRVPFELSRYSLRDQREVRLTRLNDEVLARWPALAIESFSFTSTDDLQIDAWFLSGADRERPLPTVLFIHAGPFLATGHAFRYDFHLLASQGYGVVFANFRGSYGYGEAFVRAIMGDWGGRAYPDHIGAVDAAIERGYADPRRLGVWGASHGGFATCWVVTHTNRFRAAVAEAASTSFATMYYLTDVPETYRRDLGGRPDEIPEVYRQRSPLTYAQQCTTPTMLLHGEDDLRCPISEAEQFYRALQDARCPTELYRIPGCSHLGDSAGSLSARCAQNEALVSWFGRYL